MKPNKTQNKTHLFDSLAQAAAVLKVPKELLRNAKAAGCPGFRHGRIDGRVVQKWITAHGRELAAAVDKGALKDRKLVEEIRKLRHLNDTNAKAVCSRAGVAATFGRIAQRVNKGKAEIENTWSAKLVRLPDVPTARAELRRLVDAMFVILGSCREEWVRLEEEEAARRAG